MVFDDSRRGRARAFRSGALLCVLLVVALGLAACDLSPGDTTGKQTLPTPTPLSTRPAGEDDSFSDDPGVRPPTRTPTRTSTPTQTSTPTPGTPIPTSTPTLTLTPFATATPFLTPTPLLAVPTVTPRIEAPPTETPVPPVIVPPTETAQGQAPPPEIVPSPTVEVPTLVPTETPTFPIPGIFLTPITGP
jgi:hypothetical protein